MEKPGKWKVLDTEYIIRRPWLTARRDRVMLPSGVINPEYYVLEYPTWVNVVARTTDGRFVMVEQYRHGLGEIMTELCAGVAEPGEDPETAARRELAEETGFGGGRWRLLTVTSANPSALNNLSYSFVAEDVVPIVEPHLDPTEDLRVKFLTLHEVAELLRSDALKQSLMTNALLRYLFSSALSEL
ncbi:MAG: NUDIX hydrolase [Muribaculaceae bacterium]|nr:NUDIX hydrolase [Muribaculaceae bacterium]